VESGQSRHKEITTQLISGTAPQDALRGHLAADPPY
jgi:hypothetical protein